MSESSNISEPKYEIKHRITGAIILVLLAVVLIPLMLSEPSLEANNASVDAQTSDKTFRSRIVPLNLNNVNAASSSESELNTGTTILTDSRPALLDLTKPQNGLSSEPEDTSRKQASSVVMTQQPSSGQDTGTSEKTTGDQAPTSQIELPEEQETQGWVVRVGTFSKEANVESVSTLLSNSGFKPRTTAVSTSLGSSTRVWLGPYAKKQTAEKVSDRLKSLIGEKGYVTRTNS